jgi:anthranilate 1,2-dioxygenase large subunit/terephthalate 1,2-dioxygenase oxygenase component alpha subunit
METQRIHWKSDSLTRIPYSLYNDVEIAGQEKLAIFHGKTWNFLCLEADLQDAGDYRSTHVGETPVVVVKDQDQKIYAFENRCAHRGALIALEKSGKDANFQCVYHAWSYSRQGDLTGVAFAKGVKGQGGMPASFCKEEHGPRKLRVSVFCGLVFGTFSEETPDIETYLGPEICARIQRVLHKPIDWKLYVENVKDSYHASLLHMFFTTFKLNRLSQKGGVIVDPTGGHHVSYSIVENDSADNSYKDQAIRADNDQYLLKDRSLLAGFKEYDDGITLQILSVFPGFVLQQIQNCLAVRQVLPKGVGRTELNWTYFGYADDTPEQRKTRLKQSNLIGPAGFISMEDGAVGGFVQRGIQGAQDHQAVVEMGGDHTGSSEGRATETSVRGFWKAYRSHMKI